MTPRFMLRALSAVLLLLLSLAAATGALSQPAVPGPSQLAPEARARLAQAAEDVRLAPWQREVMEHLARTGATAAPDSPAADRGALPPAQASGAADGSWVNLLPSGRYAHSAVYDPVRDRMVVFGGRYGPGRPLFNDVWALSLAGTPAWTQLTPTGTPPSARYGHSAIYDPVRDRMVLFGGYDGSDCSDVWALSLSGTPAWTRLNPTGTPPGGRRHQAAIYDPVRDRMLVFGGTGTGVDWGYVWFNDAWALSLSGTPAWTRLTTTGMSPSARFGHSAIYDPGRDRVVLFGGIDVLGCRNDVWVLDLAAEQAWTMLTPPGATPSRRAYHSATYDPAGDRMVVFDGDDDPWDGSYNYLDDVWTLSLTGSTAWTKLAPIGPSPGTRYGHAAIGDPVRHRLVVFAGGDASRLSGNDAWALTLADPPAWTELTPTATPPGVNDAAAAIHDPVRDRMVLFGGDSNFWRNEVWAFSLTGTPAWTALLPTGTPPSWRMEHSAIYDPVRDRMVVFGGYGGQNSVWALLMSGTPAWTQLLPAGTPPYGRRRHSAIYDPVRDRMVVFGGFDGLGSVNDVWVLSLSGAPTWTQLTPTGTLPSPRECHSAIYDPVRDRMVVWGGAYYNGSWQYPNDVWALSLAGTPAWTNLTPTGTPPGARESQSTMYDPLRDRMVVFGGAVNRTYGSSYYGDVWTLSLAGTPAWTKLAPAGRAPDERTRHCAAYDPVRDLMVVYGGGSYIGAYRDVWALTWGAPALAGVTCPGEVAWAGGAAVDVSYSITNPYGFAQTADYTLASARGWPGFPLSGSVTVAANATVTLPLSLPVPDSAATGVNALTFRATLRGVPQSAACSHDLVLLDPATPVQVSLVSALADPDGVRLTWLAAGGGGSAATVYRCGAQAAWSAVGRIAPDGTGQLFYEDRAVTPGARYGYRLGMVDEGREVVAGETWVDVPLAAELLLGGVRPNPGAQELVVAFSLPDAAPARLEAFDLSGRRVAAREVGPLGGGSHVVRLGDGHVLAPGVYLLRLTRGERTLTTRAVIVR